VKAVEYAVGTASDALCAEVLGAMLCMLFRMLFRTLLRMLLRMLRCKR